MPLPIRRASAPDDPTRLGRIFDRTWRSPPPPGARQTSPGNAAEHAHKQAGKGEAQTALQRAAAAAAGASPAQTAPTRPVPSYELAKGDASPAALVRRRFDALVRTSPVARALGGPGYLAAANASDHDADVRLTAWALVRLPALNASDADMAALGNSAVALRGTREGRGGVVTTGAVVERLGARRVRCRVAGRGRGQTEVVALQGEVDANALRAEGFGTSVARTFVQGFPPVWQGILIADGLAKDEDRAAEPPGTAAAAPVQPSGDDDDTVPVPMADDDDKDGQKRDSLENNRTSDADAAHAATAQASKPGNTRKPQTKGHVGGSQELRKLMGGMNMLGGEAERPGGRTRKAPGAWWAPTLDLTGGNDAGANKALAKAQKAAKAAAAAPPPGRSRKPRETFDPCRPAKEGDYTSPKKVPGTGAIVEGRAPPPPPPQLSRKRKRSAPNTIPVLAPRPPGRPAKAAGTAALKRAPSLRKHAPPVDEDLLTEDDTAPASSAAPRAARTQRPKSDLKAQNRMRESRAALAAAAAESRKAAQAEEKAALDDEAVAADVEGAREAGKKAALALAARASAQVTDMPWAPLPSMGDGVGAGASGAAGQTSRKRLRKRAAVAAADDKGGKTGEGDPFSKRHAKAPRFGIVMHDSDDVGVGADVAVPAERLRKEVADAGSSGWGTALARAAGRAVGAARALVADGTTAVAPKRGAQGADAAQRRRGRAAAWASKVMTEATAMEGGADAFADLEAKDEAAGAAPRAAAPLPKAMAALDADTARHLVTEFDDRRRAGRYVDAALRKQGGATADMNVTLPSMEEGVGALAVPSAPAHAPAPSGPGRAFATSVAAVETATLTAVAAAARSAEVPEDQFEDAYFDEEDEF